MWRRWRNIEAKACGVKMIVAVLLLPLVLLLDLTSESVVLGSYSFSSRSGCCVLLAAFSVPRGRVLLEMCLKTIKWSSPWSDKRWEKSTAFRVDRRKFVEEE